MMFFNHTTGIHYTDELVEWVVLRKGRNGVEKVSEGTHPIPKGFFEQENAPLFPAEVLSEIRRNFRGVVTVSLPSTHLLLRILELPSTHPQELKSMVELQIDQISPFPSDQLTISYEVIHQIENHSRVLAVAAPRKTVDALGDLFKKQNVYIRSLDSELLAWWSLLSQGEIQCADRTILILEEHTEFSMIVLDNGTPVHFHSLEIFHEMDSEPVMHEIAEEVRYTLLTVEATYGHLPLSYIFFWSDSGIPDRLCDILSQSCGADVLRYNLKTIPSLAEGLAMRSAERKHQHAELVPKEWVDLQRRKQLIRVASFVSIAALSIWMAVVAITAVVFSFQKAAYNRIVREAKSHEEPALAAQAAREEMLLLENYSDRSHSALESLRELALALPSRVEVTSFTYKKGDAVSLRGSGERAELIYDFFEKLGQSSFFNSIKDQSVSDRIMNDGYASVFSIKLELPKNKTEEAP